MAVLVLAFGLLVTPGSSTTTPAIEDSSSISSRPVHPNLAQIQRQYHGGPSSLLLQTPCQTSTTNPPDSSVRHQTGSSSVRAAGLPPSSLLHTPATGLSSARSRTPGSRRRTTPLTPAPGRTGGPPSVIVAIIEGNRDLRYNIGVAAIDLKRPVMVLSQFEDRHNYTKVLTKLHCLHPVEVLMPNTAFEGRSTTRLFKLIQESFSNLHLATVTKNYFDETKGLQYIKKLVIPEFSTVEHEIKTKFLCTAATAALLKYVEFIQNMVYAPASLKVVYKGLEQTTQIDMATATNLELLCNLRDHSEKRSLYGILNTTKTRMGARLLRANILQPPNSVDLITCRQEAVEELVGNDALMLALQDVLSRFLDVDHLMAICVQIPKQETQSTSDNLIDTIIRLKHILQLVQPLTDALSECTNPLFRGYHLKLQDKRYQAIHDQITIVIKEDTKFEKNVLGMRTQKCFAVKPNINGLLDVARRTYTEIVDDAAGEIQRLSEEHGLILRMSYIPTRGFHITMPLNQKNTPTSMEALPHTFIKVTKSKHTYSFTCEALIGLNDRAKVALHEIFLLTNVVVGELMKDIRDKLGCLYALAEIVAMTDMLTAFANNSKQADYVRPEFTDTLALTESRHPILDKISLQTPVPNNVYASDHSNFIVLTGPNMSGKSTYLRQIAMLQLLAQMGSFVPAQYASFRPTDQIFSRISNNDDRVANDSTFTVEMKEMNFIIQNFSKSSLIILDELGRGTSADEGVGICFAICEYLLRVPAFTFLATHFKEITTLAALYPNVENYHFEVQHVVTGGKFSKIAFTHVLSKGKTEEKLYGLQLAEKSPLPESITDHARQVANNILQTQKSNESESAEERDRRATFKLAQRLVQTARSSTLDQEHLRAYLHGLKEQYHKDRQPRTPSTAGSEP